MNKTLFKILLRLVVIIIGALVLYVGSIGMIAGWNLFFSRAGLYVQALGIPTFFAGSVFAFAGLGTMFVNVNKHVDGVHG